VTGSGAVACACSDGAVGATARTGLDVERRSGSDDDVL
jgi:hypothetical protein